MSCGSGLLRWFRSVSGGCGYPGRLARDDRAALAGILFVARTGIAWQQLPTAAFGVSGSTLLAAVGRLAGAGRVAAAARRAAGRAARRRRVGPGPRGGRLGASTRVERGDQVGPSPVDRGRPGSKHHLITDVGGIPLAVILTGGYRNDVTQLVPLIEATPPLRGRRGRPLRRPKKVYADRGYDHDSHRRPVRQRGITPMIARRGVPHGSGLGRLRWVVERTLCAARRSVVSPVQPGGTRREVPGSAGLPGSER